MNIEKLALGTVQFGLDYGINNSKGKPPEVKTFTILDEARRQGIERLDTADVYGNAIDVIGRYHKNHDKFKILNKFSFPDSNREIEDKVNSTLKKLRINAFDVYSYHSFKDFDNNSKTIEVLKKLKQEKLINKIGISIYDNQEFKTAINSEAIDVIQIPYNILDNNSIKGNLITKAKQNGKEIHARSIFLQGLFFVDEIDIIPRLKPLAPYLKKIKDYCGRENMLISELALMYVISNPNIDVVLMGVDSVEQLRINLDCINFKHVKSIMEFVKTLDVKETKLLNPVNWK
jgi:aryl-alcohol dehydrogenase-like predicted oxidoreductase